VLNLQTIFTMLRKHRIYLFFLCFAFLVASCSSYNKLLRSQDLGLKYKTAIDYFNKGDYVRAEPLFESLLTYYRGSSQAETIYYDYAYCEYKLGENTLASYHFKTFAESYPLSIKSEDAYFLYAYCSYLESPSIDLDQTPTSKAIDAFTLFATKFHNSPRIEEANKHIDELSQKLEDKAFNDAYVYYRIMDYKSTSWAFRNFLNNFPASKRKEEAQFIILKASYLLASNSIESKKEERLQNVFQNYSDFKEKFSSSNDMAEAEKIYNNSLAEESKLKNSNK